MSRRAQAFSHLLCGVGGAAGGAIVAHLLDPDRGRARRTRVRDQLAARRRKTWQTARRQVWRRAQYLGGRWAGWQHRVNQRIHPSAVEVDDVIIADKVRAALHRHAALPINVDVAGGVVHLRGEVPTRDLIETLAQVAASVAGVVRVDNYLHQPGEVAPNKAAVASLVV